MHTSCSHLVNGSKSPQVAGIRALPVDRGAGGSEVEFKLLGTVWLEVFVAYSTGVDHSINYCHLLLLSKTPPTWNIYTLML